MLLPKSFFSLIPFKATLGLFTVDRVSASFGSSAECCGAAAVTGTVAEDAPG